MVLDEHLVRTLTATLTRYAKLYAETKDKPILLTMQRIRKAIEENGYIITVKDDRYEAVKLQEENDNG